MSQWITLDEMMSKYGIDREEAPYWTSIEGIVHSKINGLVLVDNDSISTYLDKKKVCADATCSSEARLFRLKRQELQEAILKNQIEISNTYKQFFERQQEALYKFDQAKKEERTFIYTPTAAIEPPSATTPSLTHAVCLSRASFFQRLLLRVKRD